LGVIVAIGVPSLSDRLNEIKLKSTTEKIKALIDLAVNYSQALNHEVQVDMVSSGGQISEFKIIDTAPPSGSTGILETLNISSDLDVTINASVQMISFTPDRSATFFDVGGVIIVTATATFRLETPSAITADIIVFPQTGSTKIVVQ